MFKRLQRSHRSKAALGFHARESGIESLSNELLHAQVEMECDFRADVAPADVTSPKHEIEEPAHPGPDEWHDQRAGAVRMSLTVSA